MRFQHVQYLSPGVPGMSRVLRVSDMDRVISRSVGAGKDVKCIPSYGEMRRKTKQRRTLIITRQRVTLLYSFISMPNNVGPASKHID